MGDQQAIEIIEQAVQSFLSDKFLQNVSVEVERDMPRRGFFVTALWESASKTVSVERMNRVPAGFWDYVKAALPFLKPRMIDMEIHVIHRCPHRDVIDPNSHLDWVIGARE